MLERDRPPRPDVELGAPPGVGESAQAPHRCAWTPVYNRGFLPRPRNATGRSFNGRTRGSGPRYRGSNPCLPANSSVIPHFFRLTTWRITRVREAFCRTADNNSYAAVARALQ